MKFGYLAVLWLDNTLRFPYNNIEDHPVVAGYDETGQELHVAGGIYRQQRQVGCHSSLHSEEGCRLGDVL